MRYESNRGKAEEKLGVVIRKKVLETATHFERLLDAEFTAPKHGRLYGVDRDVAFTTRSGKSVSFTAKEGKLAQYKKWRGGRRKSRPSGVHRASAPGEAPAIQSAALRKSVARKLIVIDRLVSGVQIGVSIQGGRGGPTGASGRSIAHDLEFGTSRMAPRPGWRIALAKLREMYR